MKIETSYYLEESLKLNSAEDKIKTDVLKKIPTTIIDFHSHMGRPQDVERLPQDLISDLCTTYPYFSYENHLQTRQTLWGCKNIKQVVFAFPFRGVNIRNGNQYIYDVASSDDSFIPFLTGDPHDPKYTIKELKTGKWRGVKMYPKQLHPSADRIVDFYPAPILDEINNQKLPIILHLPNNLTIDHPELIQLAQTFPRVRFIIAHFGMAKGSILEVEQVLQKLAPSENIVLETSWFSNAGIITIALRCLGLDRIIYASDQPLNLIRAEVYIHPHLGERVITDLPYHWVDAKEQDEYRRIMDLDPSLLPNSHFKCIKALLDTIEDISYNDSDLLVAKEKIFEANATGLLNC